MTILTNVMDKRTDKRLNGHPEVLSCMPQLIKWNAANIPD